MLSPEQVLKKRTHLLLIVVSNMWLKLLKTYETMKAIVTLRWMVFTFDAEVFCEKYKTKCLVSSFILILLIFIFNLVDLIIHIYQLF